MSIQIDQEHQASAEHVQVRVVDGDVHPYPKHGELEQFIPAEFRDLFARRGEGGGSQNYYDPPDYAHAMAVATNLWQDSCWLDSENSWHQRYRGSICAAVGSPRDGAREIEHWAGHPYSPRSSSTPSHVRPGPPAA